MLRRARNRQVGRLRDRQAGGHRLPTPVGRPPAPSTPSCAPRVPGCTTYDCFEPGQQVTQQTDAGSVTWRCDPGTADEMFRVFAVMRALHELLLYLSEAVRLTAPGSCTTSCRWPGPASERVRGPAGDRRAAQLPRDLVGRDLRGARLDLADRTGADLRSTDVRGTDLASALFLSQLQVNACRGDARTTLPAGLEQPAHWAGATPR